MSFNLDEKDCVSILEILLKKPNLREKAQQIIRSYEKNEKVTENDLSLFSKSEKPNKPNSNNISSSSTTSSPLASKFQQVQPVENNPKDLPLSSALSSSKKKSFIDFVDSFNVNSLTASTESKPSPSTSSNNNSNKNNNKTSISPPSEIQPKNVQSVKESIGQPRESSMTLKDFVKSLDTPTSKEHDIQIEGPEDDFFGEKANMAKGTFTQIILEPLDVPLASAKATTKEVSVSSNDFVFYSDKKSVDNTRGSALVCCPDINPYLLSPRSNSMILRMKQVKEFKGAHFSHCVESLSRILSALDEKSRNVITSPFGLALLLGILMNLSTRSGQVQIAQKLLSLSFTEDPVFVNKFNHYCKKVLIGPMENAGGGSNESASVGLFFSPKLKGAFQQMVDNGTIAEIKKHYFAKSKVYSSVLEDINEWSDDVSKGVFPSVVEANAFSGGAHNRLIIVNVCYFKHDWKYRFESKNIIYDKFKLSSLESKNIYMMTQYGTFLWMDGEHFQGICLEMGGKSKVFFKMYIFLPKINHNGLSMLEDDAPDAANPQDLLNAGIIFQQKQGKIVIPKFKVTFNVELQHALTSILQADLKSLLTFQGCDDLKICQKVQLDVSDEGSDFLSSSFTKSDSDGSMFSGGVVSSSTTAGNSGDTDESFAFICDRPFHLLVQEVENNCTVYQARVINPLLLN